MKLRPLFSGIVLSSLLALQTGASAHRVATSQIVYKNVPYCTEGQAALDHSFYGGYDFVSRDAQTDVKVAAQWMGVIACTPVHQNLNAGFIRAAGLLYTPAVWCILDDYVYNSTNTATVRNTHSFAYVGGSGAPDPPCGNAIYQHNAASEHYNGSWLGGLPARRPTTTGEV